MEAAVETDFGYALKRAGLSRKEFNALTGVTLNTMYSWTYNKRPTPTWALRFLDIWLKVDVDERLAIVAEALAAAGKNTADGAE